MRRSNEEIEGDLAKLRKVLSKPRTMDEVVTEMGVDKRTVFRWFDELYARQRVRVTRVGLGRPTLYLATESR